jgi:hypothetical protein
MYLVDLNKMVMHRLAIPNLSARVLAWLFMLLDRPASVISVNGPLARAKRYASHGKAVSELHK